MSEQQHMQGAEPLASAERADAMDPPRNEAFLSRWSRVKRETRAGAVPPGTTAAEELPLPSLEALAAQGLDADLTPFMQRGVDAGLRRAAVQQLFRQPVFNVMDGLDVYIEDFNVFEPIAAEALPGLAHARELLFSKVVEAQPETEVKIAAVASAASDEPAEIATMETTTLPVSEHVENQA